MLKDFGNKIAEIKDILSSKNFQTLISSGPNTEGFSFSNYQKPDFIALENAYKNYSAFSSLNLLSEAAYGEGFKLESKSEAALNLCEPIQKLQSFKPIFVDGIKDSFIYGISSIENKWDENTILGFKTIDIKTLEIFWDEKGNITGYKQKIQSEDPIPLKPIDVTLIRFYHIGDNTFGIGLIEPVLRLMEIRQDMFESIADIFKYMAMPPVHITRKGARNKAQLKSAEKQFKDFNRKSYFITSEGYEINLLEVKRAVPDLSKYFDIVDAAISVGLRVPSKVLSGNVSYATKASALALREYSKDEIKYIRNKLKRILESQVFQPLCIANGIPKKDYPKVVWNPDPPADPSILNDIICKQMDIISKLAKEDLISKDVAKEKLDALVKQLKDIKL